MLGDSKLLHFRLIYEPLEQSSPANRSTSLACTRKFNFSPKLDCGPETSSKIKLGLKLKQHLFQPKLFSNSDTNPTWLTALLLSQTQI